MKLTEFGRLLGLERDETYKLVRQLKYVLEIVSINRQLYVTMSSYQRWRETEMRTDAQIAASVVKRSRKELPQILPAVSSVEQESTSIPAQKFFTVPEAASFLHLSERTCLLYTSDAADCALTGGFRRNGWLRSGALHGLISKDCLIRITAISKEEK